MAIFQMRKLILLILAFTASVVSHHRHLYRIVEHWPETGEVLPIDPRTIADQNIVFPADEVLPIDPKTIAAQNVDLDNVDYRDYQMLNRGEEASDIPVSPLNPQITTEEDAPPTIIEGDSSSIPDYASERRSTNEVDPPPTVIEDNFSSAPDSTLIPQSTTAVDRPPTALGGVCKFHDEWIRDQMDCGKFYRCQSVGSGFTMHNFHCPAGLHFDLKFNICNYPSGVNCGN